MEENLATLLEVVADEAGSRPAVLQGEKSLTWTGLDNRAARLARYLAGCGIGPGSRIGVALHNGPEYVETVLAAMKLRAVPVNVNYRYLETELAELVADAGLRGLVYDNSLAGRVAGLDLAVRVEAGADYEQAVAGTDPLPRVQRSADDEWLLFTGGTTGRPKGVLSRHRALMPIMDANGYSLLGREFPADLRAFAASTRELLAEPGRLVTLVAPPLMHATGLYTALATLVGAGTVVFLPSKSFDATELARELERHRVTDLCIVGDVFARPFAGALDDLDADLSNLRRILSVGVVWSADVKERILDHCDVLLRDVLAASEGGPFAISVTRRGERRPTSHFELFPGARVVDDNGDDVPPGSGRSGYLAAPVPDGVGYLGDPEGSARTFRTLGGRRYAVPGDLATFDDDGSLLLLGRGNRVINTGGEKVFAEEVERVVAEHPAVADVNIVGLADERWGQRIVAVVQRRPGSALGAEQLREYVGTRLAGYKRPRDVVFVPELRRRPTGKADLAWAREVARKEVTAMAATVAVGVDGLKELVGKDLGRTDWLEITQERVNQFADATGDHQWIHVDPERAAEGPFGGTIAHGYLTLSLTPVFLPQLLEIRGFSMGINYGCDRVRFPSPVPVGSKLRAGATVDEVTDIDGGVQMRVTVTFEAEGQDKPACVATIVLRSYL